ncbi:MAG TPA: CpaD family pilus assembly lipoprotein [Candidatus Sulfotelmatobacter sp.]|jgi:hypothetical protein|nr:CpaD family pilus assembly lipoprotein [Candidatus Sulfotelmatobacter sp.]
MIRPTSFRTVPHLTVLAFLLLGGCFPRPDYTPLPDASSIKLEAVSEKLALSNFSQPSLEDRNRVKAHLTATGTGDLRVRVQWPMGQPLPAQDSFRASVQALGIPVDLVALDSRSAPGNQVVLVLYHLTATGPDCDSMITHNEAVTPTPMLDFDKRPSVAFGCATYNNLAASVANPADLAEGRAYAGSDGESQSEAVDRYNADKVKVLRQTTSTSKPTSN